METVAKINLGERIGTYASLRKTAYEIRCEIEDSTDAEIDFSGILGVSGSFADELFGVLIEQRGVEWFRKHVKVSNLDEGPKTMILHAIAPQLGKP